MQRLSATPVRITSARTSILGVLACAVLVTGCKDASAPAAPSVSGLSAPTSPVFTLGTGSTSTLLGRANFKDPEHSVVEARRVTGDWHMLVKAKPSFDLAIQSIVFQPGGNSGWHGHPGPVFIQVVSGTMTFYESTDPHCTPIVRTAGQAYLDHGDHAHIARNESGAPATNLVTYFAPQGAALRIDKPNPGNCSF